MKRQQQPCDHSRFTEIIEQSQERDRRFEQGVERLLDAHRPYPNSDSLRPGNSHATVSFYCEECRIPWPCRVFNSLRWLYGEVRDWPPAKQPYEPLVLHRAEDEQSPIRGGEVS